jgi:hypothetical protein
MLSVYGENTVWDIAQITLSFSWPNSLETLGILHSLGTAESQSALNAGKKNNNDLSSFLGTKVESRQCNEIEETCFHEDIDLQFEQGGRKAYKLQFDGPPIYDTYGQYDCCKCRIDKTSNNTVDLQLDQIVGIHEVHCQNNDENVTLNFDSAFMADLSCKEQIDVFLEPKTSR